jgi:hypothetical protein
MLELHTKGCKHLIIAMMRGAIRDYRRRVDDPRKISAKELNKIGSYFDLHRLAKASRKRIMLQTQYE